MSRDSTFSLTIMVIIMAILAIFVGYLLGNWLIQMVTGDNPDIQQAGEEEIIENEIIRDEGEDTEAVEGGEQETTAKTSEEDREYLNDQLEGEVYVIQAGAFSQYENAVSLKQELEESGFDVIITDDPPYKVQVGATTDRNEAEETEKKVEEMGYEAFITH